MDLWHFRRIGFDISCHSVNIAQVWILRGRKFEVPGGETHTFAHTHTHIPRVPQERIAVFYRVLAVEPDVLTVTANAAPIAVFGVMEIGTVRFIDHSAQVLARAELFPVSRVDTT